MWALPLTPSPSAVYVFCILSSHAAAGGDDIICTAADCSTVSEQRHVNDAAANWCSVSLAIFLASIALSLSWHGI